MALLEIKSKFGAEFRRISLIKSNVDSYEHFRSLMERLHKLFDIPFVLFYEDPNDNYILPINNDHNLKQAVLRANPLLRVLVVIGESDHFLISNPQDFRQVSSIIDVDIVPPTCRRIRLLKHGSKQPLGFYIRWGTRLRFNPNSVEKVSGIFISRLVPGGLADSTGLLRVNDEVLEVNGIEVVGKTLDQVADMMLVNSNNLIITVRPSNPEATVSKPQQGS